MTKRLMANQEIFEIWRSAYQYLKLSKELSDTENPPYSMKDIVWSFRSHTPEIFSPFTVAKLCQTIHELNKELKAVCNTNSSGLEKITSEIADFCAGLAMPGEPETPEQIQAALLKRILPLLSSQPNADSKYQLIGYAEEGQRYIYEPRHKDRITNPIEIYKCIDDSESGVSE